MDYNFEIATKRTQSLLDFRHIIPAQMPIPPAQVRSKTPVTDLDVPDGNSTENTQVLNNNSSHMSGSAVAANNVSNGRDSCRKTAIPTVQNKAFVAEEEKHSVVGDPIYQTISSEKGAKLGRNCISLENLRTLTIKNDLHSYGNNLLQNQSGHPASPYYLLPTFPPPPHGYHAHHYFAHKPHPFMYGPAFAMQPPPPLMPPPPPQQQSYFHNYRVPFTNYGGYTNPNP